MDYALYIMNYFVPLHRNLKKNEEQEDFHNSLRRYIYFDFMQ